MSLFNTVTLNININQGYRAYRMICRLFTVLSITVRVVPLPRAFIIKPYPRATATLPLLTSPIPYVIFVTLCCTTHSYHIQLKPPRLVFVGSQPDPNAHFFVLSFSRSGHRMTLVDPPPAVGDTIGIRLRQAFRPHVTSEGMVQEGILAVELRRGVFGGTSILSL